VNQNIKWGMHISLEGDDKVQGQFKQLDKTVDDAAQSFDNTASSANKTGDNLHEAAEQVQYYRNKAGKLVDENGKFVAGIKATGKELSYVEKKSNDAAKGLGKVGNKAEKSGKQAKKSKSLWKSLKDEFFSLKGMIASVGLGFLTNQIIEVGNVTEGWKASMYAITGSHMVANQELEHSRNLAKQLGADIKSTTNSYVQFTAATKGTGLEGFKTTKVFDAVSKAMRVLNRSADDTSGALKALEQMVSKGTVQAEELRGQLGERLPGAFGLAAQAMGVTTAQLGKMLEGGKVLAEDLLPKLADVLTEKYGAGLTAALNSPAQAFRNLKNALFEFYEGLSNSLFDELATGAQALADALQAVIPHLPAIISGLGTLAKIIGVSGALYLGYLGLAAIIPIVTVATAGYTLASLQLQASLLLATISQKFFNSALFTTIGALSTLKVVMFSLIALYAGWEIGSWLSENFLEARLAGLAFVRGMEVSFAYLSTAFAQSMAAIKFSWQSSLNGMREMASGFYTGIASALNAVGATGTAAIYTRAAASYTAAIKPAKNLTKQLNDLSAARDKDISKIDQIINSLVDHEIAVSKGTIKVRENTAAKKVSTATVVAEITANEKLINSLKRQIKSFTQTGKEKLVDANLSKLSAKATQAQKDEVIKLTESLYEQQQAQNQTKLEDDFYQNAIDGVNGYSDAWSSAGNVIVDTFGSIAQQMEKLFAAEDAYSQALAINHKKQKALGADTKKLKAEEYKLNYANTQAQVNSYSSIAGAAAGMFKENSKAAKAAHAVEQALAVASLAMSLEKMLSSTTETAVVVANETVKQTALGTTAIITQGQGDPYTAWARIAAMIALVAGLGIATSGGSGSAPESAEQRQKTQGTGTVLGSDEKSSSILNAYERIEALELDQYAELRQMNDSLHDLNNNITHLATSFVSSFGKFDGKGYGGQLGTSGQLNGDIGGLASFALGGVGGFIDSMTFGIAGKLISGFKSTKKSLVDSGISIVSQTMGDIIDTGLVQAQQYFDIKTKKKKYWGAKKKTSYNTEYNDIGEELEREMALIFGDIGDSINSAVDVLGLDVTKNLDNFVIALPNISFKDLSGDEVKAELEAIFSSQSDLMATYLVPGIVEFQQVGEGLFDTLIRVAQEQAVFNSAMENIGKTFASVSTEIEIGIAQSLVELMGGIESFSESTNAYFAAFFSDEEKFNVLQKQLTSQFKSSSAVLPETRKEFRALVDALDLTTQSGQKAYASLVKLSPQLDEYYAQMEALESDRQELFAGILSSLGDSLSSTIGEYLNLLNSEVNAQIRTEQQRINEVNREVKNAYKEQLSAVNALHSASKSLNNLMQSLLLNDLSTLNPLAKFDEAQSQFDALFTRAESGDVDAANSLGGAASTLLTLGKELFASSATYKDLFVDVNNQLSTVADITGTVLAPTESDELTSSALLEQLNNSLIVEEAVSQSELLGDILTQLQSVAFATGDDVTTLAESMGLDLDQLPADIRAQIETIGLALDATMADITFADSIDALGDTLADNFALSIGDIDTNVDFTALITAVENANDYSSLNTALTNLETAVATVGGDVGTSLAPWFGNSALANDIKDKLNQLGLAEAAKQDAYIASLAELELNLDIEIPINGVLNPNLDIDLPEIGIGSGDKFASYDKGTPYVPHDQLAQIHQGEIIMDPQSSAALRKYGINVSGSGGDNTAVVAEIKNLNNNIERLIIATEKVEQAADSKQVVRELKNNRLVTKTRKFG
jgi:tape measure domain-containing protein